MKTKCAKQPLVSVIVPVYKVETYLQTCVDSILEQPYKNIEVILVDDGSPDRCPMICEEYAQKDPRIRVIHQENRGLPAARNTGLRAASGAVQIRMICGNRICWNRSWRSRAMRWT